MHDDRLYNILHLAARIHGLIWAAYPELEAELIDIIAKSGGKFRRAKADRITPVTAEFPVLILISVIQAQEKAAPEMEQSEAEFLKSCLVHFFATHSVSHYLERTDPIKELLNKVDWYLDGDKGAPAELFIQLVASVFPDLPERATARLLELAGPTLTGRIDKAIELAPLYNL